MQISHDDTPRAAFAHFSAKQRRMCRCWLRLSLGGAGEEFVANKCIYAKAEYEVLRASERARRRHDL